jgi:hypothetical protein
MKQSLERHKYCLKNQEVALEKMRQNLEQLQAEYKRAVDDTAHYRLQVDEAEKKKKDGFDRDKFMKK